MRIKRVEVIGFKSFCDRAVLNIEQPITAVVGPNGCGKSNIIDAIRWCMGEQSAKHLRGKTMEDVIFAGSETRGPAPMAEVSLTFDDVGFSHETLAASMQSDEAQAEAVLAQVDAVPDVDAAALEGELPPAELAEAAPAAAAVEVVAEAAPPAPLVDAEGQPVPSASAEVAEMLADEPPAIDFTQYTEVTITRRLYRDGTSNYLINKVPCRLRDVTDFFLGTGVGTKAYAIIEQGRIGQIVSSRPQDRRLIIEEAAGITKFKSKKKAAEKKLEQTKQNLLRISDIVAELDKRMGTLRRQAQKAERYRSYKQELRDLDLWKASHRYLELRADAAAVNERLTEATADRESVRADFDVKDSAVIAERAELALEERRVATLQEQLYELDNRVRLAESKIGFQTREAGELDERAVEQAAERERLLAQRADAGVELAARQAELEGLAAEVAAGEAAVGAAAEAATATKQELAASQSSLDRARGLIATARADQAKAEAQAEAMVRRREESDRRLARVTDELAQVSERLREVERESLRATEAIATLRQTRLDLGNQAETWEARQELLAEQVAAGESRVEMLRTETHRRRSRLQSLVEIQERYEGFARGTRAVMQRSDEIAARVGATRGAAIRGLVADVVRAPETLELAVEAALGDRLGGVLVEDAAVGVAAIGYLKSASAGRSAFVPVPLAPAAPASPDLEAAVAEADHVGASSWQLPTDDGGGIVVEDRTAITAAAQAVGGEGVLGRLVDLVPLAEGFAGVAASLFGDAVVVDSLERAVALHQAGAAATLVTVDGDVVDARGVVAGGSRDNQGAGVLGQKREIRELEEIVAQLDTDLTEATAALVTAKTELRQVEKALEGLRREAHQGDLAIMSQEKDAARLRSEFERVRERATQLGHERVELDERLATMGREADDVAARRADAAARVDQHEREQLGLIDGVTAGRDRVDAAQAELTTARVRAAQLGEKRAGLESAIRALTSSERELGGRIERIDTALTTGKARSDELRADAATLAEELVGVRERRRELAGEFEAGRRGYDERLQAMASLEIEVRDLRARAERLTAEVSQLELRAANLATAHLTLVEGTLERYQLELVDVVPDYHQRGPVSAANDERAHELRELLDRMSGDINLTAIDEYGEVAKRHEFLTAQQADLEHAVDQLEKAIDKINKTSRRLFKEAFTAINTTFKEVFPRLFRGGQAHLSLSTGKDGAEIDILEAGVEIFAQPPGKKNSTVDQLSGGEKALTAVALVFSIFLIKPSPFCILDEVDAPLDEANVDRYNEIVREMTDRSQFIVISHNKRTMESADNLYGVTMQEAGVSKLVSVNLAKLGKQQAAA
ncbi:MAG: chromosome segregation protein SMC [Myxococcales bacterium]|nr:chromosome segregation protein SMC [Myxococcales bacterium]